MYRAVTSRLFGFGVVCRLGGGRSYADQYIDASTGWRISLAVFRMPICLVPDAVLVEMFGRLEGRAAVAISVRVVSVSRGAAMPRVFAVRSG